MLCCRSHRTFRARKVFRILKCIQQLLFVDFDMQSVIEKKIRITYDQTRISLHIEKKNSMDTRISVLLAPKHLVINNNNIKQSYNSFFDF